MKPERILINTGIIVIAALLALLVLGFLNGYDERLASIEQELIGVKPEGDSVGPAGTDSARLRDSVVARTDLWDPLVPEPTAPPPPPPQAMNLGQVLQGVTVLPGGIGVGDGAEVRISTPTNTKGAWFKKGDTVVTTPQGAVLIQDITGDSVIVGLTHNGDTLQHRLPRP